MTPTLFSPSVLLPFDPLPAALAAPLLAAALLLPLALACLGGLPALRRHALAFLPFAPLPGLGAALFAPAGTVFEAPDLLFGLRLELGAQGTLFLGFAALLWTAAGVYARAYMRESAGRRRFVAFWCLTLAGNLGVFLAGDVATFYAAFACVSLAAYPLVVHGGSAEALRAGRLYIVLAMLGETALLLGFMLGAVEAETLAIADVRAAIATSPARDAAMALLIAGFGIKAGLVPLHLWLPRAHPAAPTPASAVLSGAIVKAGIFGLMQFLPFGTALPAWHALLLEAGLVTVWFGILAGLAQSNPKTVLAYSTVSQMGIVIAVIAMALQGGATGGTTEAALAAASLYALHHGLAKGALFMGVGVIGATGAALRPAMLAALALPALSVAGAPLTGGALAKLVIKPPLDGGAAEALVTFSAIGTSLLLLRFLFLTAQSAHARREARPPPELLLPWLAVIAAAFALPWALFAGLSGESLRYPLTLANLWNAVWPLIAAITLFALARQAGLQAPRLRERDPVAPVIALAARISAGAARAWDRQPATGLPSPSRAHAAAARLETWLSRWSVSGPLLLALMLLAVASMAAGAR